MIIDQIIKLSRDKIIFSTDISICDKILAMENEFESWLISEMKARYMTQSDLAKKAGVSPTAISNVLSQQRSAGTELCQAIARALGYPPEYVFRQAGLLPPKKTTTDPAFDRFEARLALLTPENRERIYRLIELEYQMQLEEEQRSEQARQKSTGPKPAEAG